MTAAIRCRWTAIAIAAIVTSAHADDAYRYGPHWGIEKVDAKTLAPVSLGNPEKALLANGITFNITYMDSESVGFNDPAQGAARKSRIEEALSYIANIINENGELDVLVAPSQSDGSGFLAAGVTLVSTTPGYQAGSVHHRLENGAKQFPGQPEIQIIVDFGFDFYSGTGNPDATQIDLLSVLIHEVTHTLGFISGMAADGSSRFGPGVYTTFDTFLQRRSTALNLVTGSPPAFSGSTPDLTSNDIVWKGMQGLTAFGAAPPVDSRIPFRTGGSLQHWDPDIPRGGVMVTAFAQGATARTYRAFEIGALVDIGYIHAAAYCKDGEEADICYSADKDCNHEVSFSELLRVVQFFNWPNGFGCQVGSEDGYAIGSTDHTCAPYSCDYKVQDWAISLPELLRVIQFYNSSGLHMCSCGEDDYCPNQ